MDRGFKIEEPHLRPSLMQMQERSLGELMRDKEEELDFCLELRTSEEEHNCLLLQSPYELDAPLGLKPGAPLIFKITSPPPKEAADDFLNLEGEKNDYDWLLTPPGTPLFPSMETESNKNTVMTQIVTPNVCQLAVKARAPNGQAEPVSKATMLPRPMPSSSLHSSRLAVRRPSSSGVSASSKSSRSATPTSCSTLPATSKPSRSSTPRTQFRLSSSKPAPLSKPMASLAKPSKAPARALTPTSQPTMPATKSPLRLSTPIRRPATSSRATTTFVPPVQSSSASKTAPALKNSVASRGISPMVRSKASKPSDLPDFSVDASPKLRHDRPVSASSRGRPGAISSSSSSMEPVPNGRTRRLSCSPSRAHAPNGETIGPGSSSSAVRLLANDSHGASPIVIGSKMVQRIINMRKLAPPKQDDRQTSSSNPAGKPSLSSEGSGFGRTLSKKSLDMALRHMDIGSISGNLCPLMTNAPASSVYSVRTGPSKNRNISVSNSPIAASSNCSSEPSTRNNVQCLE